MSVHYRDAGVDLLAAEEITARITKRLGSGLFGGFMPVSPLKAYDSPVLVSSIDGIGTKVRLAALLGNVDGLGKDIVHHCVNDIAVHGAEPLFFLDYIACHSLQRQGDTDRSRSGRDAKRDAGPEGAPGVPYRIGAGTAEAGPYEGAADEGCPVERIVDSIASACQALGVRLAGGETAEMPLIYPSGHFDIAGAVVGVVEEKDILDGRAIREGDVLVGLPSSGLHTNGYSLVQHLFDREDYERYLPAAGSTLGEALLVPHRCYLTEIRSLRATGMVHGLAHITGGGIESNLQRILPPGLQAFINLPPLPPLFRYLESCGIPSEEMLAVFNLGIGLIAVCDPETVATVTNYPSIGTIQRAPSQRRVIFNDNR